MFSFFGYILKNSNTFFIQTNFDAPAGSNPIALDLLGLGKGEAWVNGQSIGRYWPAYSALDQGCSYIGRYDPGKCHKNSGEPSQQLYELKNTSQKFKCCLENYNSDINDFQQVPRSSSMVETKWQYICVV